jgi:hypothetical protein
MNEKPSFGEMFARNLEVGDIVEWSKWNSAQDCWDMNYGIIIKVKNEIKSNRLVSISRVIPINDTTGELEFFTLSLRLVSAAKREELAHEFKN